MVVRMDGFVQIAQKIVKTVSNNLPFPISLSDEHGMIIGDPNPERIGTFHPAYQQVIESDDFAIFDEEDAKRLDNVFPGIAVPLRFQNKIIGVLGIIGPPEEVKPYAEMTKHYVELMWQEMFYRQLSDLEDEMRESYLQYLLLNEAKNETRTKQYCQELGIAMDKMVFCVVVSLGNFLMKEFDGIVYSLTLKKLKSQLLEEIHMYFHTPQLMTVQFLNKEKIILLFAVDSLKEYHDFMEQFNARASKMLRALKKMYNSNIIITAGKLTDSIFTIHHSYQEAEQLLHQYESLNTEKHVLSYYDWDVLVDLLPHHISEAFTNHVLFRISKFKNDRMFNEIIHSFVTYCECGMNITATANALYIHRNTVIYRLNKLEELTAIDVKNFQHCSLLYLILKKHGEILEHEVEESI